MAKFNNNIKSKLNQYFLQNMGMYPYKRGWIKGDCPECGKPEKFGVHLGQNRSNCFVCGYTQKPINIVMAQENFTNVEEAYNFLRAFDGITYLEPKNYIAAEEKEVKLPESYRLITFGNSMVAKVARKNLEKRGFDILKLAMAGIGYCTTGDYENRIIIPFYEGGKLVYFNARRIFAEGSKFKNPSAEEFGIGKSLLIFNIDALAVYRKIYLVESATNSLTLGGNAIAIGGKDLSNYQASKILQSPVEYVVIGLDSDAWGKAIEAALKLTPYKKVKLLRMPEDEDINDIGSKATRKLEKQSKFLSYGELIRLKNEYEVS